MRFNIGTCMLSPAQSAALHRKTLDVDWDERELVNGHILIAGGSGTGKTHTIRKICREMLRSSQNAVRIHVFDVHDDIEVGNSSDIQFSEATDAGLNPLIIDTNIHTGGVRKAIQNFILTINKTSRQLGERQEAALRALLEELYSANGFRQDSPESWRLNPSTYRRCGNRYPNLDDLSRWGNYKYKQLFVGGNSECASALDKVNREANKLQREVAAMAKHKRQDAPLPMSQELADLKQKAIDAYTEFVNNISKGDEFDSLLKYDSKNTLKSVLDRIENLRNCGVFRDQGLNFDPHKPVWRYRIKDLSTEAQKLFVYFRLRELYIDAMRRGEQNRIVEVIVIDESSMFMDASPDNMISIMANQIRKFGTALICASQAFTHFSDDFLASAGTKIVLGIDEMFWDKTCRQLQLKKEHLGAIVPKKSALINMKRTVRDELSAMRWTLPNLSG